MVASLQGPKAKVRWARVHLKSLKREVGAWLNLGPYKFIDEVDREAGISILRVHVLHDPPEHDWSLIVGDFIHNLRSALDHLVWQLVLANGEKPREFNAFPVALHATRYWCARKGGRPSERDFRLKGVSDEHRAVIDETQPYRRGAAGHDSALAILNDLWNRDKHRVIHPALVSGHVPTEEIKTITGSDGTPAPIDLPEVNRKPLVHGAELVTVRFKNPAQACDLSVYMKPAISLNVGFGERPPRPLEVFDELFKFVVGVIEAFEPSFPGDHETARTWRGEPVPEDFDPYDCEEIHGAPGLAQRGRPGRIGVTSATPMPSDPRV